MAKKKKSGKKGKKRSVARKTVRPKMAKKKAATAASKKQAAKNEQARRARLSRGLDDNTTIAMENESERSFAAGQSSDVEGLSDVEDVDSESVEELAEEGQDYEAEIIDGVERAGNQQEEEVRTDVQEEERPRPARRTL
jgi:hypothetical protein